MKILAALLALILFPASAFAQGIPVIDIQAILQRARILEQLERTREQAVLTRRLLDVIRHKVPAMDRYRMPSIPVPSHDVGRFPVARDFLTMLNAGDASYASYGRVVVPLPRGVNEVLTRLPPEVRREITAILAGVELTDSANAMAAHQLGITRGYTGALDAQIAALEADVTSPNSDDHELGMTAGHVAVGELLSARQGMVSNQLLAESLDQRIAANLQRRNAEASWLNARVNQLLEGERMDAAVFGDGSALRTRWWVH